MCETKSLSHVSVSCPLNLSADVSELPDDGDEDDDGDDDKDDNVDEADKRLVVDIQSVVVVPYNGDRVCCGTTDGREYDKLSRGLFITNTFLGTTFPGDLNIVPRFS